MTGHIDTSYAFVFRKIGARTPEPTQASRVSGAIEQSNEPEPDSRPGPVQCTDRRRTPSASLTHCRSTMVRIAEYRALRSRKELKRTEVKRMSALEAVLTDRKRSGGWRTFPCNLVAWLRMPEAECPKIVVAHAASATTISLCPHPDLAPGQAATLTFRTGDDGHKVRLEARVLRVDDDAVELKLVDVPEIPTAA